jgi:hypothetical protein
MPSKKIKRYNKTRSKKRNRGGGKNKITKRWRRGGNGNLEYISNLDNEEINILRKYTERHDLYPLFLRSNKKYKQLYDEMDKEGIYEIDKKIEKLNELLRNINIIDNIMINKAPVIKQDTIVYRGTKNAKKDDPYLGINKGYISTSKTLDALTKNTWRFLENECCLYKIVLKKGVPYINLSKISYFGEQHSENQEEILLPRGLKTTLESVSETEIQGNKYKTYNVNIGLDNQETYSVEPIENSQQIQEMFTIFQKVNILFDIAMQMNKISQDPQQNIENREKTQDILGEDDFDFYNVNMETIDDLLMQKYPFTTTIIDYNNYLNDLLASLRKVIRQEDNNSIVNLITQLQK